MAGTLIRSIILGGAAEKIRQSGRKPAAIAKKSGLPVAALSDPDLLVNARAVITFFENAAEICQQRNWGLEMSAGARLSVIIGPLWVLLRNAQTVRQMCRDLATHFDVYSSSAFMAFHETRAGGILQWSLATGHSGGEVQMAEFSIATFLNEIRLHGPPGWTPRSISFRHDAPADLRLHRRIFGPHLRFNSERNAIELDATILARPLAVIEPGVRSLIQRVIRNDEGAPTRPVEVQVEAIVRGMLPYGRCSADDVSLAMGVSTRTLQHHLQEAGCSFRAIKNAVRADLASKYLKFSDLNVTQVAAQLGYNDPTSLSRSFKRWHGFTAQSQRRGKIPKNS